MLFSNTRWTQLLVPLEILMSKISLKYIPIHIHNFEHSRVIMNMKLSSHGLLFHRNINRKGKKGKWCVASMVTHTRNLSSAFNPSKCTLTAVNTHPEQWAAMLRRPGSSWGFGALLKGLTSVVVLKVERALVIHSPTDNPCRTWESNQ